MEFAAFVVAFWKKLQWSGKPWEPGIIATVTGLPLAQVEAWWKWLQEHDALSDPELAAEWDAHGLVAVNTPGFGTLYVPKASGDPGKTVGQLTVGELEAMFVRHCGK